MVSQSKSVITLESPNSAVQIVIPCHTFSPHLLSVSQSSYWLMVSQLVSWGGSSICILLMIHWVEPLVGQRALVWTGGGARHRMSETPYNGDVLHGKSDEALRNIVMPSLSSLVRHSEACSLTSCKSGVA